MSFNPESDPAASQELSVTDEQLWAFLSENAKASPYVKAEMDDPGFLVRLVNYEKDLADRHMVFCNTERNVVRFRRDGPSPTDIERLFLRALKHNRGYLNFWNMLNDMVQDPQVLRVGTAEYDIARSTFTIGLGLEERQLGFEDEDGRDFTPVSRTDLL